MPTDVASQPFAVDLLSRSEYYPFGMEITGLSWNTGNNRYGFGGTHEMDNEVKGGVGNHLSFGDFGYDTRVARRFNLDPIDQIFISNYAGFANNPIYYTDPSGYSPSDPGNGSGGTPNTPETPMTEGGEVVIPEGGNPTGVPTPELGKEAKAAIQEEVNKVATPPDKVEKPKNTENENTTSFEERKQNTMFGDPIATEFRMARQKTRTFEDWMILGAQYSYEARREFAGGGHHMYGGLGSSTRAVSGKVSIFNSVRNFVTRLFGKNVLNGDGFTVHLNKFNYFFGRVTTGDIHNINRSKEIFRCLTKLGVSTENQLLNIFNNAWKNGKYVKTITNEHGTTISKAIEFNGSSIHVGFFYEGGNLNLVPRVSSMIIKL